MILLSIAAALLSVPVAVLLIEVISALRPSRREAFEQAEFTGSAAQLAVIVPAHNESTGLIPTLDDIRSQLSAIDRVIVVADNCSDDTAAIAAAAGADVLVRNDRGKIGKGYAMAWGIAHLEAGPPDLVMFVDADCRLQQDLIERMKQVCSHVQRPVQALFLMRSAENSPINHGLAEFAWILKNHVRPLGLRNLGAPVQLMGTGMMFPWPVIRSAPLASSDIVEDMKLGLDLASLGKAPYFFPFATVTSEFPTTSVGTETQRERWVKGHLVTILKSVPGLLGKSFAGRNANLLILTLDVLVPPLSLLALLVGAMLLASACAGLVSSSWVAASVSLANFAALVAALLLSWSKFGRRALPARQALSLGGLMVRKISFYGRLFAGRTASHWIRTDRTKLK